MGGLKLSPPIVKNCTETSKDSLPNIGIADSEACGSLCLKGFLTVCLLGGIPNTAHRADITYPLTQYFLYFFFFVFLYLV